MIRRLALGLLALCALTSAQAVNIIRASSVDTLFLEGYSASTVSLTTSAAQSAALEEGYYAVWTTADCFIRVGPTATGVTTANGFILRTATTLYVYVPPSSKIGGIVASSTATLSYHKVG